MKTEQEYIDGINALENANLPALANAMLAEFAVVHPGKVPDEVFRRREMLPPLATKPFSLREVPPRDDTQAESLPRANDFNERTDVPLFTD